MLYEMLAIFFLLFSCLGRVYFSVLIRRKFLHVLMSFFASTMKFEIRIGKYFYLYQIFCKLKFS
eukprot:UN24672